MSRHGPRKPEADDDSLLESGNDERGGSMKVSLSVRLQEAWKKKFGKNSNRARPAEEVFMVPKKVKPPKTDTNDLEGHSVPLGLARIKDQSAVEKAPTGDRLARGTRNECKTLDARYNRRGDYELKQSTKPFECTAQKDTYSVFDEYCLVVTRRFDQENKLITTTLRIQSPFLIKALRAIVKYYPDNPVDVGNSITVGDPPALICHYRHELEDYARRKEVDDQTKLHIDYVLTYLRLHIGEEIEQCEKHLAKGLIKFQWLWMIFRSSELVYSDKADQLYFFQRGEYKNIKSGPAFLLHCNIINYDGKNVGKEQCTLAIPFYESPRELSTLTAMPLKLCKDVEGLKSRMIARAHRFLQLRDIHPQYHDEIGRVMVDCKTYQERVYPKGDKKMSEGKMVLDEKCTCDCAVCKKEVAETPEDYDHELRKLSEGDMLLTSANVYGFSLSEHTWTDFRISDLSDILWSDHAIEDLVMDKKQKKVILSLVMSPIFLKGVCTDIIGWKGKGLVVLLHGSPGTGKTLTAECICEHLKRPLYIVSGGELGSTPGSVEKALKDILDLSIRWNAIILIDEADVFLEQRSATDIYRNSLVSVFLRQLEYFEGMLFLTTNRVERFDDAFTSRIHLALNYPDLIPNMRRQIWHNSLKRFPEEGVEIDYATALDELAKEELNGRVISYAVRTAKALADADKEKLKVSHLWDVVNVYQSFNKRLTEKQAVDERTAAIEKSAANE